MSNDDETVKNMWNDLGKMLSGQMGSSEFISRGGPREPNAQHRQFASDMAQSRDAMLAEGFSRDEAMHILMTMVFSASHRHGGS